MKMKKFLIGTFLWMFTIAWVSILPNHANAVNTWFDANDAWWWKKQETKYNADVAGSKELKNDALIKTIQTAINWVLWILSMIALVLCLWGGFQMMTSGGDSKKYESGLNVLKWAAIGLAIIAASWLIVSLIFYVINGSIGNNNISWQKVVPNNGWGNGWGNWGD